MKPRYNDPLYNEVLGITNDVLYPSNSKICKKNLNITKPRFFEQILPIPWPLAMSRFHCKNNNNNNGDDDNIDDDYNNDNDDDDDDNNNDNNKDNGSNRNGDSDHDS